MRLTQRHERHEPRVDIYSSDLSFYCAVLSSSWEQLLTLITVSPPHLYWIPSLPDHQMCLPNTCHKCTVQVSTHAHTRSSTYACARTHLWTNGNVRGYRKVPILQLPTIFPLGLLETYLFPPFVPLTELLFKFQCCQLSSRKREQAPSTFTLDELGKYINLVSPREYVVGSC